MSALQGTPPKAARVPAVQADVCDGEVVLMARKRKGGKRSFLSKAGRKAGSLIGSLVQVLGIGHGLTTTVSMQKGDFANYPQSLMYHYGGLRSDGSLDTAQTAKSLTIIAVSWFVGWGIKQVARRL